MSCGHCTSAVQRALKGVEGVRKVHVDLDAGSARITTRADVDVSVLLHAVDQAGYEASLAG